MKLARYGDPLLPSCGGCAPVSPGSNKIIAVTTDTIVSTTASFLVFFLSLNWANPRPRAPLAWLPIPLDASIVRNRRKPDLQRYKSFSYVQSRAPRFGAVDPVSVDRTFLSFLCWRYLSASDAARAVSYPQGCLILHRPSHSRLIHPHQAPAATLDDFTAVVRVDKSTSTLFLSKKQIP